VLRPILIVVCTTMAGGSAVAAACEVFEHMHFTGESMAIERNHSMPRLGKLNDRISSVKVGQQCTMIAYADEDYKGAVTIFSPGEHATLPAGWDDQISSLLCRCQ
jgi:hypothetical protein